MRAWWRRFAILLDAAAAYADVPLLALITVLESDLHINRKAWTGEGIEPWIREAIIKRSRHHTFTQADFDAIATALQRLEGKSNRAAWDYLRQFMPAGQRLLRLAGVGTTTFSDAIDDLGTDSPGSVAFTGKAVRARSEGARGGSAPTRRWKVRILRRYGVQVL